MAGPGLPSGSYLPPPGTFTPPFRLSGYGQNEWHTSFGAHPLLWGGVAAALACCLLWKRR